MRSWTPAALAAATTVSAGARESKRGDVLGHGPFDQPHTLRQVPDVAAEIGRCPLIEGSPSSRTCPRAGCQTPTSPRTSDDLPDPLWPMTPTALPARGMKLRSLATIFCWPGGTMLEPSTISDWVGGGSWTGLPGHRHRRKHLVESAPALARRDTEHPRAQSVIHLISDPDQEPTTGNLQEGLEAEQSCHKDRRADKCRDAAAWQNTAIPSSKFFKPAEAASK